MLDIQLHHKVTEVDASYFTWVHVSVEHVAPGSKVKVRESVNDGIIVTIIPTDLELKDEIVGNLLALHKNLKIKPEFNKSHVISKNICYRVSHFDEHQQNLLRNS